MHGTQSHRQPAKAGCVGAPVSCNKKTLGTNRHGPNIYQTR